MRVTGREFTVEWAIRRSWWAAVKRQKILGWEPRCTDIDTIVTAPLGAWLLENGVIPCEDSGKKTRRFRIKLEDIINFLVQHIQ